MLSGECVLAEPWDLKGTRGGIPLPAGRSENRASRLSFRRMKKSDNVGRRASGVGRGRFAGEGTGDRFEALLSSVRGAAVSAGRATDHIFERTPWEGVSFCRQPGIQVTLNWLYTGRPRLGFRGSRFPGHSLLSREGERRGGCRSDSLTLAALYVAQSRTGAAIPAAPHLMNRCIERRPNSKTSVLSG